MWRLAFISWGTLSFSFVSINCSPVRFFAFSKILLRFHSSNYPQCLGIHPGCRHWISWLSFQKNTLFETCNIYLWGKSHASFIRYFHSWSVLHSINISWENNEREEGTKEGRKRESMKKEITSLSHIHTIISRWQEFSSLCTHVNTYWNESKYTFTQCRRKNSQLFFLWSPVSEVIYVLEMLHITMSGNSVIPFPGKRPGSLPSQKALGMAQNMHPSPPNEQKYKTQFTLTTVTQVGNLPKCTHAKIHMRKYAAAALEWGRISPDQLSKLELQASVPPRK